MAIQTKGGNIGQTVWIKCRAREKCEGNNALVQMKFHNGFAGKTVRYKCLTCKNVFTITT